MDLPVTADRRREHRFPPPAVAEVRATLRPGCRVALIDLHSAGALVEAPRPLRPGGQIQLLVTTVSDRYLVNARVVWCVVTSLSATGGVTYRGGLAFDEPVTWQWARAARAARRVRPNEDVLPAAGLHAKGT